MDRFRMAACGLAAAVLVGGALSGCGAGQVSQTATQEPAVNGTSANIGEVTLRNIHVQVTQTSDFVQPGTDVELMFQASNQSRESDDKLLSISSEVGPVTLTGDTTVPAGGVLIVGAPDGQITPLESVEAAEAAEASVALTKPITNGLTYEFTFTFEKAGEGVVRVPLSAGEAPRRDPVQDAGKAGGHSGGH